MWEDGRDWAEEGGASPCLPHCFPVAVQASSFLLSHTWGVRKGTSHSARHSGESWPGTMAEG